MRAKTFPLLLAMLGASLVASGGANAETLTVGGDMSCRFHSLQAALDHAAATPGTDVIKVARNKRYGNESLTVVDGNVVLVGGYSACDDEFPLGHTSVGTVRILGPRLAEPEMQRIHAQQIERENEATSLTAAAGRAE